MENKINIAELLKDCPTGMELDCTMYEDLYFDYVDELNNIHCYIQQEFNKTSVIFNQDGTPTSHTKSKCVIFPKGKTTWKGFQRPYEDGDIVATTEGLWIGITTGGEKGKFIPVYCVIQYGSKFEAYLDRKESWVFNRLATEEEKAKLFQAIKANGYVWNAENKTLKKLAEPKFKKGDIIQDKDGYKVRITNVSIEDECYGYESLTVNGIGGISFNRQDKWELVPNKFDITTLVPFESRVLVRHNKDNKWCGSFFSHIDKDLHSNCYKFVTIAGKSYPMMIPYEENQHLLGTTDDCDEFYKI